jgi:hypothetical protein
VNGQGHIRIPSVYEEKELKALAVELGIDCRKYDSWPALHQAVKRAVENGVTRNGANRHGETLLGQPRA